MKKVLPLTLTVALLSSCSFIPSFTQPDVEVPVRWKNELSQSARQAQIPAQWWTLYQDETLNALVEDALTQNLDLRAGFERVNQARSALRIAGASMLPSASASLGAERARTNPAVGPSSTDNSFSAGLAISYDLDLFGSNRATIDAARASLRSEQYEQEALKLVTISDLTEAYFNLLSTRERVRIAEDNLKNSREVLRIINIRVDTGLDSDLELSQQRVAVSSSEAALATLRLQESVFENALALYLGRAPQTFDMMSTKAISQFPVPEIALEQPSVLLERRPDIHVAEQNLIAANANIGVARAAFFPSLNLGGTGSAAVASLGDPATTLLAATASLAAPLFTGGRLEGGLDQANSRQRELVEVYRKTVLVAFREVEDALAATRAAQDREVALRTAMNSARRAYDISRKRYEVGTIDFQTLLDTQAALLSAEDSYAQALDAKLTASVDLVKALGGGWSDPVAELPVPDEEPAAGDVVQAIEEGPVETISVEENSASTSVIPEDSEPQKIIPQAGGDSAQEQERAMKSQLSQTKAQKVTEENPTP
ncbi:MAG TPA: efflux transporter outer membrane subunit [Alphaproteobacteria bacterium]|nr:efflux transporter outer membrane subunit [Alphaproteobacteria bacterium]HOO50816.1 efflux transporter outer membrane subunit [Alphaproteobacteria bacterium]